MAVCAKVKVVVIFHKTVALVDSQNVKMVFDNRKDCREIDSGFNERD